MADHPVSTNDGPSWDRIKDLFSATFEAGADERRRILDELACDDYSVRRRVEELLAAHDRAGGALDRPALETLDGLDPLRD